MPDAARDQGKGAIAVTNDHAASRGIDTDVVGIVTEPERIERGKLSAFEAVNHAVAGIGHEDRVGGRDVGHALRLSEPIDPAQDFACSEIQDAQAVVAELGHE